METRKIVILTTGSQSKKTIESSATTLGELKRDMDAAGISYGDYAFYEGVSKTELKSDDSILPHDIPFKGTITNNLAIMLTNGTKKIKSGSMTRAEAYETIKSNGWQRAVVDHFGKNFTQVSTESLVVFITNQNSAVKEKNVVSTEQPKKECKCLSNNCEKALRELVECLYENDTIGSYDKNRVLKALGDTVKQEESPFSSDDLEDMFNDIDD